MDNATLEQPVTAQLLTVPEVAARLRFTARHVRTLVATGQLKSLKVGRSRRFTEQHLADFLAAHEDTRSTAVPGQLALDFPELDADTTPETPAGDRLAA